MISLGNMLQSFLTQIGIFLSEIKNWRGTRKSFSQQQTEEKTTSTNDGPILFFLLLFFSIVNVVHDTWSIATACLSSRGREWNERAENMAHVSNEINFIHFFAYSRNNKKNFFFTFWILYEALFLLLIRVKTIEKIQFKLMFKWEEFIDLLIHAQLANDVNNNVECMMSCFFSFISPTPTTAPTLYFIWLKNVWKLSNVSIKKSTYSHTHT